MSTNEKKEVELEDEPQDMKSELQSGIKELAKRLAGDKKAGIDKIQGLESENRALKEEISARDDEFRSMEQEHSNELSEIKEQLEEEKGNTSLQIKAVEEELNAQKVDAVRAEAELREEYEEKMNAIESDRDAISGELNDLREHSAVDKAEWTRQIEELKASGLKAATDYKEKEKILKGKVLDLEEQLKDLNKSLSGAASKSNKELAAKDKEIHALKMETTEARTAQEASERRHAREIEKIRVSAANQALKELEKKLFEEQASIENEE